MYMLWYCVIMACASVSTKGRTSPVDPKAKEVETDNKQKRADESLQVKKGNGITDSTVCEHN